MSIPDPGGDILDPGAAEKMAEQVVDRRYLFKPKDEEAPPDGSNWFEHNYRSTPAVKSIRVQIDPKPLAQILDPFIQASNFAEVLKLCNAARIEVASDPSSPIITLRLVLSG